VIRINRIEALFKSELKVINIGVESFYKDLREQKIKALHVEWRPTAGGNKKMLSLLSRLKK